LFFAVGADSLEGNAVKACDHSISLKSDSYGGQGISNLKTTAEGLAGLADCLQSKTLTFPKSLDAAGKCDRRANRHEISVRVSGPPPGLFAREAGARSQNEELSELPVVDAFEAQNSRHLAGEKITGSVPRHPKPRLSLLELVNLGSHREGRSKLPFFYDFKVILFFSLGSVDLPSEGG
jgi:hypothetical protein